LNCSESFLKAFEDRVLLKLLHTLCHGSHPANSALIPLVARVVPNYVSRFDTDTRATESLSGLLQQSPIRINVNRMVT